MMGGFLDHPDTVAERAQEQDDALAEEAARQERADRLAEFAPASQVPPVLAARQLAVRELAAAAGPYPGGHPVVAVAAAVLYAAEQVRELTAAVREARS